jgi:4-amino-4-deoxy-L-arabinose transferase-like glycosyltransferase
LRTCGASKPEVTRVADAGAEVGQFDRAIAFARRRPATVLGWVLGLHLVVWTVLPLLVSANLQLDLVEDLALGKEWQLGYWKHPPLPWWLADLLYRITGNVGVVYLLGPLASLACFYGVWRLARELVGELDALIAVLTLEGIHFYNFSAVKFAHDQVQLPFWAFTGLYFYRALVRGRMRDWLLAGLFLAGAYWSKYAVFVLGATLGLFLLIDPLARRAWRTPGPYAMAAAFLILVAPNAWWLVQNDFMPLHYVDARARAATVWYDHVVHALQWIGGQVLFLLPAAALLALLHPWPWVGPQPAPDDCAVFNRRYVTALALGPFVVTTVIAVALGRLPVAMWGYPLWSFAPLAVLMWAGPASDPRRLRRFAAALAVVLVGWPAIYAAAELGEPFLRDRPKATQFPGRQLAAVVTQHWRAQTGQPLTYVAGARPGGAPSEFAANNVAVYSRDRPHVVVQGELRLSPWIDREDLERRGLVLVWEASTPGVPENLRLGYPRLQMQPPLVLPRRTLYPRPPLKVYFAIVPPRS